MKRRVLEEVEITRTDGQTFYAKNAVLHKNVVAFILDDRRCIIPLANVGFISAERDITEEVDKQ